MKGNDPDFMMNFQKQIKNNSVDLQNLVDDLANWSEETISKESKRNTAGGSRAAAGQAAAWPWRLETGVPLQAGAPCHADVITKVFCICCKEHAI